MASFGSLYAVSAWLGAGANAAILAAVLALTLSRRHITEDHGDWLREMAALPLMGLAAAGVGWTLHHAFWAGAVLLVAGIAVGIWLRRYGGEIRRLGAMLVLPLIAVLITPAPVQAPGGLWVDLFLVLLSGLVALGFVWLAVSTARRMGKLTATGVPEAAPPAPQSTTPAQPGKLAASTRMAAQMAVALAASVIVGKLLFAEHWPWAVITAYIICSSSVARGDTIYRSALRLGGAVAATLLAAALQHVSPPQGMAAAALIFATLFVGVWLREVNYALWAFCITLIVALLQETEGQPVLYTLELRLEAILTGAICAVAAAWWVLPIRTSDLVRKHLADALLALEGVAEAVSLPPEEKQRALHVLEHRLAQLEKIAAALHWHHRLSRLAPDADHPSVWIAIARQYRAPARDLASLPPGLVRNVKLARRTVGQRDRPIVAALQEVLDALRGELPAQELDKKRADTKNA